MEIKTNKLYWDCDCPDEKNYIHLKSKGNYCKDCMSFSSDCPDSRQEEIDALYVAKKDKVRFKDQIISATTFQLKHKARDKKRIPFKCHFDVGDYVELSNYCGTIVALDEATGDCKIEIE
jgi:hypothetical protein